MKTFFTALLVLLCSASYAQITLEHEILDSNFYFSLIQVDSGEYYYLVQHYGAKPEHEGVDLKLFDLEYNLVKEIHVPIEITSNSEILVAYISRKLFDLDDGIEYVLHRYVSRQDARWVKIFDDSEDVLFSCDSCSLGFKAEAWEGEHGIYNTPKGTKMLIIKHYYPGSLVDPTLPGNRIYSLPGKLPTNTTSSVTDDIAYIQSALNIESFPNPASDRIQVNYKLPAGATSGFITIRDTKGAELQRHRINYTEETIALDTQGLSPGSYYCCLLTDDGRTAVKKMMVVR